MWDALSCFLYGRKCNRYGGVGKFAAKYNVKRITKWFI